MDYQQKYLKYKKKYLELKNHLGGVVDCDLSNRNTQEIYNLWGLVIGKLQMKDENYRGTRKRLERHKHDSRQCNLWIWNNNIANSRDIQDRNHIDVYMTRFNHITDFIIGITVKIDSIHFYEERNYISINSQFIIPDYFNPLDYIADYIATKLDHEYLYYFGQL